MSRMDRVNQQIKREIGQILQKELSDPRLEFVSITHVKTSNDLRNAQVYFSVLGNAQKIEDVQRGLTGASGMIRRLLSSQLNLRNTPELTFRYDHSIEDSVKIEETLKEIHDENSEIT